MLTARKRSKTGYYFSHRHELRRGITPKEIPVLLPLPLPMAAGPQRLRRGEILYPRVVIVVPLLFLILGTILKNSGLFFDKPPSLPEQDPAKRLAAEREDFLQFLDGQRSWAVRRQNDKIGLGSTEQSVAILVSLAAI